MSLHEIGHTAALRTLTYPCGCREVFEEESCATVSMTLCDECQEQMVPEDDPFFRDEDGPR